MRATLTWNSCLERDGKTWGVWQLAPCLHALGTVSTLTWNSRLERGQNTCGVWQLAPCLHALRTVSTLTWNSRLERGQNTWDVWQFAPCLHALGTMSTFICNSRLGRGRKTWDVWQLAPCLHTLGTSRNLMDFRGKMFLYIDHVMSYKTPRISWYYDICKGITKPLPKLGGLLMKSVFQLWAQNLQANFVFWHTYWLSG